MNGPFPPVPMNKITKPFLHHFCFGKWPCIPVPKINTTCEICPIQGHSRRPCSPNRAADVIHSKLLNYTHTRAETHREKHRSVAPHGGQSTINAWCCTQRLPRDWDWKPLFRLVESLLLDITIPRCSYSSLSSNPPSSKILLLPLPSPTA
jgi:hypothetical protein